MHVKAGQMLMLFILLLTSLSVQAHTGDSHVMSFSDALLHLVTQFEHVLLLTPIILLILGNYLYKLIARVNKPYRGRNDRI